VLTPTPQTRPPGPTGGGGVSRQKQTNIVVSITIAVLRVVTPYSLLVLYIYTSEASVHLTSQHGVKSQKTAI
jgi:hypothetical protein